MFFLSINKFIANFRAKIQTMKIISSKNKAILKKGLVLASILLSFSCFSQQTINGTMMHDGIARTYKLYVPAIDCGIIDIKPDVVPDKFV